MAEYVLMPIHSTFHTLGAGQSFTLEMFGNVTYLNIATQGGNVLMYSSNFEYTGSLAAIEADCVVLSPNTTYLLDIPASIERVGDSWLKFEQSSGPSVKINVAQLLTAEN